MLKDFTKVETFLTVVKERSFSKASAKLGISQPAVTQQIKFIENYLDAKIIERKKNGIKLTKEGEKLLAIFLKLEKSIQNAEKEMIKILKKDLTFVMGASFTIGNYILPDCLNNIKDSIKNDVFLKVDVSDNIIEELLDKKIDVALIESPIFKDGIIYREWMEDELVLFSNSPIPKNISKDDLQKFEWICREDGSNTRKIVSEMFEDMGIDCNSFNVKSVVSSSTAVKQTVIRSSKSSETIPPTVSIISKYVISDEVQRGELFEARIKTYKLKRKFYIAYSKERKNDAFIENVVSYLMDKKR